MKGKVVLKARWHHLLFARIVTGFLLFAVLLGQRSHAASGSGDPNFVVVLLDDAGWRDVGFAGNAFIETPHMDQLAAEGMTFPVAYATHPFCSPTRQSMITGQWPARTAWMRRSEISDPEAPRPGPPFAPYTAGAWTAQRPAFVSLPQRLKDHGYATAHIGKWHFGLVNQQITPTGVGFDLNFGGAPGVGAVRDYFAPFEGLPGNVDSQPGEYLTDRLTEETIAFIRANKDRPFFVQLWHYAPHTPIQAPEATVAKYRAKRDRLGDPTLNPTYAAMLEHVDTGVGRIREALAELGLDDRTVIMLASDNGAQANYGSIPITSVAPFRAEKEYLYEGGIRIPMAIYWPTHTEARSAAHVPVTVLDLYPTILDMAGIPLPESFPVDGRSLTGVLSGDIDVAWNERLLFWYEIKSKMMVNGDVLVPAAVVRQGPWKMIRNYGRPVELYHLDDDPGETNNRADERPDLLAGLNRQLDDWLADVGVAPPVPNPAYDPDYVVPRQLHQVTLSDSAEPLVVWHPGDVSDAWIPVRMAVLHATNNCLRIQARGMYPEIRARELPELKPGAYLARVHLRVPTSGRVRLHWGGPEDRGVIEFFPDRDGQWHTFTGVFQIAAPIRELTFAGPTHLEESGQYDPSTQPDFIDIQRIELFRYDALTESDSTL